MTNTRNFTAHFLDFHFHPGGVIESGPTLQRWVRPLRKVSAPKGRLKRYYGSAVPSGLELVRRSIPTLKRWAIVVSPFGRALIVMFVLCFGTAPSNGDEAR